MKKLSTLFMLLPFTAILAQGISTSEKTENFSTGSHNAIVVNIPYGTKEIIEDQLKNELKDWGGKYNSSKEEQFTIQASSKDMGDKNYDAYAKILTDSDGSMKVAFAIDLGGAYLSSREHNEQFTAMTARIKKFAKKTSEKCIEKELEAENKILSTLEKNQRDLEKDQRDYENSIEDYKKKITEAEDKIKENANMQQAKKSEISTQTTKIGEVEKKKKSLK